MASFSSPVKRVDSGGNDIYSFATALRIHGHPCGAAGSSIRPLHSGVRALFSQPDPTDRDHLREKFEFQASYVLGDPSSAYSTFVPPGPRSSAFCAISDVRILGSSGLVTWWSTPAPRHRRRSSSRP
jgi:hypothetical protein